MQSPQTEDDRHNRLRFVFNDLVSQFEYASELTYGDVARRLRDLPTCRHGDVVEIDVLMGARGTAVASASRLSATAVIEPDPMVSQVAHR